MKKRTQNNIKALCMVVRQTKCTIVCKTQSVSFALWLLQRILKIAESTGIVLFNEDFHTVVFPQGGSITIELLP